MLSCETLQRAHQRRPSHQLSPLPSGYQAIYAHAAGGDNLRIGTRWWIIAAVAALTERAAGRISGARGRCLPRDVADGIACENLLPPPTATDEELEGGPGLLEQSLGDASAGRG
jgi:hypothetical protein